MATAPQIAAAFRRKAKEEASKRGRTYRGTTSSYQREQDRLLEEQIKQKAEQTRLLEEQIKQKAEQTRIIAIQRAEAEKVKAINLQKALNEAQQQELLKRADQARLQQKRVVVYQKLQAGQAEYATGTTEANAASRARNVNVPMETKVLLDTSIDDADTAARYFKDNPTAKYVSVKNPITGKTTSYTASAISTTKPQSGTLTPSMFEREKKDIPAALSSLSDRLYQRGMNTEGFKRQYLVSRSYIFSFAKGVTTPILHPIETVKGIYGFFANPTESGAAIGEELKKNPGGTLFEFKGFGKSMGKIEGVISKYQPIRISKVEVKADIVKGDAAPSPTRTITDISIGLEFGSYAKKLFSITKGELPTKTVLDKSTPPASSGFGKSVWDFEQTKGVSIREGRSLTEHRPSLETESTGSIGWERTQGGGGSQPLYALGGKQAEKVIGYTPAEIMRIRGYVEAARALGKTKGLNPETPVFQIEGLKDPIQASKVIISEVAKEGGIFFGSGVTQRLPSGQSVVKLGKETIELPSGYTSVKMGDVDVIFPKHTQTSVTPVIERIARKLQASGETVIVSPKNPRVIQFKDTGVKMFEAKTSKDVLALGEEIAAPGFLGFKYPDLHQGIVWKTPKFGIGKSITSGEQFLRKIAASLQLSPGGVGETASFSEVGILGKQKANSPRGLKDVAGSLQQGYGNIAIKEKSINIINQLQAKKGKAGLDQAFESYKPEQQADIITKFKELTGAKSSQDFIYKPSRSAELSESLFKAIAIKPSPTVLPSGESAYFISSPSAIGSPVISARSSPIFMSPLVSRVTYTGSSPYAPSPSNVISPRPLPSASPLPSPSPAYSPSPRITGGGSPSPSPSSPSPIIPSPDIPSPIIPSPTSPSPSPTPSPTLYFNNGNTIDRIPFRLAAKYNTKDNYGGFGVEVRRGGLFKLVTKKPLSRKEALAFGGMRVGTTAAATFRLVKQRGERGRYFGSFKRSDFYKKQNLFIEKKERRIKSKGELKEITFKGVASSRRKRGKKYKNLWGLK